MTYSVLKASPSSHRQRRRFETSCRGEESPSWDFAGVRGEGSHSPSERTTKREFIAHDVGWKVVVCGRLSRHVPARYPSLSPRSLPWSWAAMATAACCSGRCRWDCWRASGCCFESWQRQMQFRVRRAYAKERESLSLPADNRKVICGQIEATWSARNRRSLAHR